jgi:hypothetical protein
MEKSSQIARKIVPLRHIFPLQGCPAYRSSPVHFIPFHLKTNLVSHCLYPSPFPCNLTPSPSTHTRITENPCCLTTNFAQKLHCTCVLPFRVALLEMVLLGTDYRIFPEVRRPVMYPILFVPPPFRATCPPPPQHKHAI